MQLFFLCCDIIIASEVVYKKHTHAIMAPHGKELSNDLKDRIVALHKDGQGYKKIGASLKLSPNTVAKVIQRFTKTHTTVNASRNGRPRKLNARYVRQVRNIALKDRRRSAAKIAEEVSAVSGQSVGSQTIRRILHHSGLRARRPRRKPLLKPSHKKARKEFAEAHQAKPNDYWQRILWSDETKINLFGSDGVQHVWRQPGEEYQDKCVVPTVKHGGGSVMVWGCMSAAGTGDLRFIEGNMDSTMYCEILKEKMLPSLKKMGRKAIFQHDNDPKHRSKHTSAFLKKAKVSVLEWPSMSPDLNPIEHMWGILKRKVEERNVSNITQLREIIQEEWNRIPTVTCASLVNSMPRRVAAVLKNNGGHTKY